MSKNLFLVHTDLDDLLLPPPPPRVPGVAAAGSAWAWRVGVLPRAAVADLLEYLRPKLFV